MKGALPVLITLILVGVIVTLIPQAAKDADGRAKVVADERAALKQQEHKRQQERRAAEETARRKLAASQANSSKPGTSTPPPASSEPETRLSEGGDAPITLEPKIVDGGRIWVPRGWTETQSSDGGVDSLVWHGPQYGAYIRLDATSGTLDPEKAIETNEQRFSDPENGYTYERLRIRTGNEAYLNGAIWNMRVAARGERIHRRAIAYFSKSGKSYGLVVSIEEEHASQLGNTLTVVLNSLHDW